MAAEPRRPREARRTVRMHSVRLLLDLLPELLVEQRALFGTGRAAAGHALGQGQPRRSHRRAARQSRGPVPALSLPHHHELRKSLSEGPQSLRGDRRAEAEAGRAADLDPSAASDYSDCVVELPIPPTHDDVLAAKIRHAMRGGPTRAPPLRGWSEFGRRSLPPRLDAKRAGDLA